MFDNDLILIAQDKSCEKIFVVVFCAKTGFVGTHWNQCDTVIPLSTVWVLT